MEDSQKIVNEKKKKKRKKKRRNRKKKGRSPEKTFKKDIFQMKKK